MLEFSYFFFQLDLILTIAELIVNHFCHKSHSQKKNTVERKQGKVKRFWQIFLWCNTPSKCTGSAKYLFFWKLFKKKLLNIFLNFFFYLKAQSFWLIIESNFIQTAASAGHAVAYTIGPIFNHISDCLQLYFTNGFTNIAL